MFFQVFPAMIYLIGMPIKLVPGTSLFVTIFVTGFVTISHAFTYNTIDLVLVLILIAGSIAGVHTGQKIGQRLDGSQLKALLAILMLSVGLLMADASPWDECSAGRIPAASDSFRKARRASASPSLAKSIRPLSR